MTAKRRDYYSSDEVRAILGHLSSADLLRLRKLAKTQAMKLRDGDPDTLLAEGFARVRDVTRQWLRGLEVGTFMNKVFGSIVSAAAKHDAYAGQFEARDEVDTEGLVAGSPGIQPLDPEGSVPDQVHATDMLNQLMARIAGDQDVIAVAMGRAEGLTAQEAQTQFQLPAKRYDAARKRLIRAIEALREEEFAS